MLSADFEACAKPRSGCEPKSGKSFIYKYQKHKPYEGTVITSFFLDDKLYSQEPAIYRANSEDKDFAQIFVEMLEENIKNIHKELVICKES